MKLLRLEAVAYGDGQFAAVSFATEEQHDHLTTTDIDTNAFGPGPFHYRVGVGN